MKNNFLFISAILLFFSCSNNTENKEVVETPEAKEVVETPEAKEEKSETKDAKKEVSEKKEKPKK